VNPSQIPHLRIIIGACVAAVAGYAVFSVYAVMWLRDPTMTGDVIGTWKSFAVMAFGFWLGSSSGGKSKEPVTPTGQPNDPVHTVEEEARP
jgi:hypothetical protein